MSSPRLLPLVLALTTVTGGSDASPFRLSASATADPVAVDQHRVTPSARFRWPVSPHRVVRRFHPPATRWGPGHRGVDLEAHTGAAVTAPADGSVSFSGVIAGRGVLSIEHREGFSTTYEPVSERVAAGSTVRRGQRIATLDAGHCSPTACLHWGYKLGPDAYRDPLTLVGRRRPVLLPPVAR